MSTLDFNNNLTNDDEYDYEEDEPRVCSNVITCEETKQKEDKKMASTELKEIDLLVKAITQTILDLSATRDKFAKKLEILSAAKEIKRSPVQRKDRTEIIISKDDLDQKYQSLFSSNLVEMKMSSFENVLKAYFNDELLKSNINYSDIAVTDDEYKIHLISIENNQEANCITTKDISTLIKRMYKTIDNCTYSTDLMDFELEYSQLVNNSPNNAIGYLERLKLIKIDQRSVTTISNYSKSVALTHLLAQIPRLKHLKLVETNMEAYFNTDGLIKLIKIIQDPLTIYSKICDTALARSHIEQLELPLISYMNDRYFKFESLQKVFKNLPKTKKPSLPTKDNVFYQLTTADFIYDN